MGKIINVAVVGLKSGLNLQCYFFKRMADKYRVRWLCDMDKDTLAQGLKLYEVFKAQGTRNIKDILNDPEVELITIATPCITHYTLSMKALEAGKHVLVEKPIAAAVKQAQEMINTAHKKGLILTVDHVRRFYANQKAVKKIITDNVLGKIVAITLNFSGTFEVNSTLPWKERFMRSHAYDYLCHHIDQMIDILGVKPLSLYSRYRLKEGVPVHWEILLNFPQGILASVNLVFNFAPYPKCPKWTVLGEKGTFIMEFKNDMGKAFVYQRLENGKMKFIPIKPICTPQDAFKEFYRQLYSAITDKRPVPVEPEDALLSIKVLWGAMKSAKNNTVINLRRG